MYTSSVIVLSTLYLDLHPETLSKCYINVQYTACLKHDIQSTVIRALQQRITWISLHRCMYKFSVLLFYNCCKEIVKRNIKVCPTTEKHTHIHTESLNLN